jgi:hypothetical protein
MIKVNDKVKVNSNMYNYGSVEGTVVNVDGRVVVIKVTKAENPYAIGYNCIYWTKDLEIIYSDHQERLNRSYKEE